MESRPEQVLSLLYVAVGMLEILPTQHFIAEVGVCLHLSRSRSRAWGRQRGPDIRME